MKYNRREIMTRAWAIHGRFNVNFADALRKAWYEAKCKVARYNVYGKRIHDDSIVLLLANATDAAAQECKYVNQYRYDDIEVKVA